MYWKASPCPPNAWLISFTCKRKFICFHDSLMNGEGLEVAYGGEEPEGRMSTRIIGVRG